MNTRRAVVVFCAALVALQLLCTAGVSFAQPRIPLVTFLIHGTESAGRGRFDAFLDGMRELGYAEGRNYRLEVRWSDNQLDRLSALARELLQLKPDVAVAAPVVAAQAYFRESKTVPIVMASGAGAMRVGLIASLARPGGNVTGVTNQGDDLTEKHFELLREIAPRAKRVLTLSSGQSASEPDVRSGSRTAAKAYGMTLIEAWVDTPEKIRQLLALCARERCEAMVALLDPFLTGQRKDVIALADKLRLPSIYYSHEFVEDGGLVSYSADFRKTFYRAATYVDKLLKGAKAGDLPVEQPTTFELVINMKTAKALGLKIPNTVLVRAERVIQ